MYSPDKLTRMSSIGLDLHDTYHLIVVDKVVITFDCQWKCLSIQI